MRLDQGLVVPTGESRQSSVVPTPNCEHLGTAQFPQPRSEKLLGQGAAEDAERPIWSKSWESVIASPHKDIYTPKCLSFLGHMCHTWNIVWKKNTHNKFCIFVPSSSE